MFNMSNPNDMVFYWPPPKNYYALHGSMATLAHNLLCPNQCLKAYLVGCSVSEQKNAIFYNLEQTQVLIVGLWSSYNNNITLLEAAVCQIKNPKKDLERLKTNSWHLVLQFCQSIIKLLLCFLKNRHLFKKGTVKRHDILWVEKCGVLAI